LNLIAYPKSYSLVSDGMQLPVYFISDVHLMDQLSESETNNQKPLYRFLDHIKHTGGTLFINGDLFDFYFEYKDVIPKGYFPIQKSLKILPKISSTSTFPTIIPRCLVANLKSSAALSNSSTDSITAR